jgi:uncharacterized protein GlcG (DUF336 family)
MRGLSLEQANTIIGATFAAAKKRKCRPMSAIVLDAGGRVKAFQKQDGASMLRFEICYGKAYGALALGRPSKLVLQKAQDKPLFMQSLERLADYPLFLEGGGQLIRDKTGELIGAVGVTGDANELDDLCAIAGIHAAKLCADSDFFDNPELMRALSIIKLPCFSTRVGRRNRGRPDFGLAAMGRSAMGRIAGARAKPPNRGRNLCRSWRCGDDLKQTRKVAAVGNKAKPARGEGW